MSTQSPAEQAMAALLIEALDLDDVTAEEIGAEAPLFGRSEDGLGLDSIDALEIALAVQQEYGVELRADDDNNKKIFASLRTLTEHVAAAKG